MVGRLDSESTMKPNELTPAQLHALFVIGRRASKFRKQLSVGDSPLDFGVHVTGSLVVGADQSFVLNKKPTLELLAAALIARLPKSSRARIIDEIIEQGIAKTIELDNRSEQVEGLATTLIDGTTISAQASKAGSVTGKFDALLVQTSGTQTE